MSQEDRPVEIAPSILSADFMNLQAAVREAEKGGAERIQIDVMDGRFVPNITFGPGVVQQMRRVTHLVLEAHLMIVEPEKFVDDFARAGADLIIVHQEVSPHLYRTIQQIHDRGCKAGVAINPATHWIAIEEVLDQVDHILVMTVSPGFGGQQFIRPMLKKIAALHRTLGRRELDVPIEVDGGIDAGTAEAVVAAGARILVAGTSIFGSPEGVAASIAQLRESAARGLSPELLATDVE